MPLRVAERFLEAAGVFHLVTFQNGSAIEALDVLRLIVFRDQTLALVWAGGLSHPGNPNDFAAHYNIADFPPQRYKRS